MVTIKGLSEEDKGRRAEQKVMESIAREVFPDSKISSAYRTISVSLTNERCLKESRILLCSRRSSILSPDNKVVVCSPELLDSAVKLAEAYERYFGEPFVVQKDYE